MLIRLPTLKMDGAGDGTGGGGGSSNGAGSTGQGIGSAGASGGGGLLSGGGTGSSTNGAGATGGSGVGASNSSNNTQVVFPENWKLGLPEELQKSGSLEAIQDIPSLVKSYINAQKLIGADKIPMPSKHATPEEWRAVYHKLGLPQDVKDYKIELPKDAAIDESFTPEFAKKAHELGIMPQQAQNLMNWFNDLNKKAMEDASKNYQTQVQEGISSLRKEWGASFDQEVAAAQAAVEHLGGPEFKAYLAKNGLDNDPVLAKVFAKVGAMLKEDGVNVGGNAVGTGALSPAAAQDQINQIMGDMNHPYWHGDHPGHKAAVEEMSKLHRFASGGR